MRTAEKNNIRLSAIADIRMGATLRGRDATRPVPSGSCHLVRIGDISQDGELLTSELIRIEPNDAIKEDLFLQSGDVLFPNRGGRTTALVYRLDVPRTLVGAQFFVVSPDVSRVLPEYLAWFLRSDLAARYFEGRRKGSYVPIIQRSDLADMEIPLPSLEVQQIIVEAAGLALKVRVIEERLAALNWSFAKALLSQAATHQFEIQPKEQVNEED
ncbi:MAG: restriction endonuclease subunit S [bacterium]